MLELWGLLAHQRPLAGRHCTRTSHQQMADLSTALAGQRSSACLLLSPLLAAPHPVDNRPRQLAPDLLRCCRPSHHHHRQAMTLIANFLLDHKLDNKPLYLHGMSSGATFALKLPRELQARQADLERCAKEGGGAVSAKSERSKTKKARSRRDLLAERRTLAAAPSDEEEGGGEAGGLSSINCKELPDYQFPPVAKMQLILRQLRGIISSERQGWMHAGMLAVAWGTEKAAQVARARCRSRLPFASGLPFLTLISHLPGCPLLLPSRVNTRAVQLEHLPA